MGKSIRAAALILVILAGIFITPAQATEEDLFDTAAAAKHLEKGRANLQAKKYDAAIKEFEASASINPDAEAYYYLGYTYYLKSKKEDGENRKKSLENFEKVYEIDPSFSPGRNRPAEIAVPDMSGPAEATPPASQPTQTAQ